jgi:hypothetical protein
MRVCVLSITEQQATFPWFSLDVCHSPGCQSLSAGGHMATERRRSGLYSPALPGARVVVKKGNRVAYDAISTDQYGVGSVV